LKAIFRPVSELEPSDRAGDAADVAGSVRSAGYGRSPVHSFRPARTAPCAVAALDAATVVTCAADRGALSSSASTDNENPPSVLGSVKFFRILVA